MTGLLVVGHGSTDEAGVGEFHQLLKLVGQAVDVPVAGGFIELSAPPLREAVASLVQAGQRHLGVVPLMLVAAGHAKGDIPAALARELSRHPGLSWSYGRPLGVHPILLDLLDERLSAVLADSEREQTAVVLVGRGSTDPDANGEHAKVARLFFERAGVATVEVAFVSLAAPGVPAALERARLLGARRIVVVPYFLFDGVLPARVVSQARDWAGAWPEIQVRVSSVIGPVKALAELTVERFVEALRGDIRMNCDTCMYRVAMPGHEDRVGAPGRPHHHPDDPSDVH
ncbi:MAG: sirohydrochlorin chelatase [Mycobacteriales bacterium]